MPAPLGVAMLTTGTPFPALSTVVCPAGVSAAATAGATGCQTIRPQTIQLIRRCEKRTGG